MKNIVCDKISNRVCLSVGWGELDEGIGPEFPAIKFLLNIGADIGIEDIQKACGVTGILANDMIAELKNIHKKPRLIE
jgi:hypothetical protein